MVCIIMQYAKHLDYSTHYRQAHLIIHNILFNFYLYLVLIYHFFILFFRSDLRNIYFLRIHDKLKSSGQKPLQSPKKSLIKIKRNKPNTEIQITYNSNFNVRLRHLKIQYIQTEPIKKLFKSLIAHNNLFSYDDLRSYLGFFLRFLLQKNLQKPPFMSFFSNKVRFCGIEGLPKI